MVHYISKQNFLPLPSTLKHLLYFYSYGSLYIEYFIDVKLFIQCIDFITLNHSIWNLHFYSQRNTKERTSLELYKLHWIYVIIFCNKGHLHSSSSMFSHKQLIYLCTLFKNRYFTVNNFLLLNYFAVLLLKTRILSTSSNYVYKPIN